MNSSIPSGDFCANELKRVWKIYRHVIYEAQ